MTAILKLSDSTLRKQILGLWIAFGLVTSYSAYAIYTHNITIAAKGRARKKGLKIFEDIDLTQVMFDLDWGEINITAEAFTHVDKILYVKSYDNKKCTALELSINNFVPLTAANYMTVTWDYDNVPLNPEEMRAVTIRLTIDNTIEGIYEFSFDININGVVIKCQ